MSSPQQAKHANLNSLSNEFGEELTDLEILQPLSSPGGGQDLDMFTHNYQQESDAESNRPS